MKKDIDKIVDKILDEVKTGPGGHVPDGSGPPSHGKGMGPGKGTKSGKGMEKEEEN